MATFFNFGQSRSATFTVRRVASKDSLRHLRPVVSVARGDEPLKMTPQEADVFFAACEAPMRAEINIFEHLPEVALWSRD